MTTSRLMLTEISRHTFPLHRKYIKSSNKPDFLMPYLVNSVRAHCDLVDVNGSSCGFDFVDFFFALSIGFVIVYAWIVQHSIVHVVHLLCSSDLHVSPSNYYSHLGAATDADDFHLFLRFYDSP